MMMYEYMDYDDEYSDDEYNNDKNKKEALVFFNETTFKDRDQDINERGKNILVYDYNGEIVTLSKAKIWYNNNGDYVEPRKFYPIKEEEEHENYTCLKLQKILMKIFCINTQY